MRYRAIAALNAGAVVPVGSSNVAYGAPSARVGSWRTPNESQKTENKPMTIIEKKLPMIHSKTMAKVRRRGPVKKKIPLRSTSRQYEDFQVPGGVTGSVDEI